MPTAACGINCDVCKLHLLGVCSTCGSGTSEEGLRKRAAQERLFGAACPVLECAVRHQVEYCTRDCDRFPCDRFSDGPYPYSRGFLNMQERRRNEKQGIKSPSGLLVDVPVEHWEDLGRRDMEEVCRNASAILHPPLGVLLPFLKEYLLIDPVHRHIQRQVHGGWERMDHSLLELLCLAHLLTAGPESLVHEIIGVNELKSAHFFRGPHELNVESLIERYGKDIAGFQRAAEAIGGEGTDMADASYVFTAFPKVPVYYLLWEGDDEFEPRLSVLFDRSVEHHLTADSIWGLVNLLSEMLLKGKKWDSP
jgi:hypothetical protein